MLYQYGIVGSRFFLACVLVSGISASGMLMGPSLDKGVHDVRLLIRAEVIVGGNPGSYPADLMVSNGVGIRAR